MLWSDREQTLPFNVLRRATFPWIDLDDVYVLLGTHARSRMRFPNRARGVLLAIFWCPDIPFQGAAGRFVPYLNLWPQRLGALKEGLRLHEISGGA